MAAYDAFLLVSFGGPEGPDDVLPFLENVTRGRGVPKERLAAVAEHYYARDGISPINGQCRALLAKIGPALADAGLDLPLYWGNRNWGPYLTDTVRQLAADGKRSVIAFVTSAYSSYSACRQYLDDLDQAVAAVGPGAPRIDKIRPYFNHPGFIEPFAAAVEDALATLPAAAQRRARLVFTAHSIPVGMAASSGSVSQGTLLAATGLAATGLAGAGLAAAGLAATGLAGAGLPNAVGGRYAAELLEASRLIAERVRGGSLGYDLVYQSRSGPPSVPWLEPDVNDHLAALARGVSGNGAPSAVVVVPVGFVSDHMEVVHDLDDEAAHTAAVLGLPFARAKAPGPTAAFAAMVAELVAELTTGAPARALGDFGPRAYATGGFAAGTLGCPADCCRYIAARPARPGVRE